MSTQPQGQVPNGDAFAGVSLQVVGDHSLPGAGLGGAAGYSAWMADDIGMGD